MRKKRDYNTGKGQMTVFSKSLAWLFNCLETNISKAVRKFYERGGKIC
jgi:hypothetical protein